MGALEQLGERCVAHVGRVVLGGDEPAPLEHDNGVDVLVGEVTGSFFHTKERLIN